VGNRLFMIMETKPEFSLENKEKEDQKNPKVQEWEALMSQYQQQLPFANPDEKWVLMDQIFKL
jgi:L-rhamnose mutarotase